MFDENNNLYSAEECGSCLYERALCLQEGECILRKLEEVMENQRISGGYFS